MADILMLITQIGLLLLLGIICSLISEKLKVRRAFDSISRTVSYRNSAVCLDHDHL
jgi:hypothetical protein